MMKHLLVALVLGVATTGSATATPLAPVTAPVPANDAEKLVALLVPDQMMVKIASGVLDNGIRDESKFSPEKKALYAANPGLKEFVAAKLRVEMTRLLVAELPSLRSELGAVLSAEMTPAEIGETLTFFSSPTGRKMLTQMYTAMADTGSADEAEAKQAAMAAMMGSLTEEDYPALMAFASSAGATKLKTVTPRIGETSKAWAAKLIAKHGPALMAMVEASTAEFKAKQK